MTIYIDIVMSIIEEVSWMSKSGCSDKELLDYTDKHYDEIECVLNGEKSEGPKSGIVIFALTACNMVKTIDYQIKGRSIII